MRTRRQKQRCRVWCWHCGHRARRVRSGSREVVGRRRRVDTYGECGANLGPDLASSWLCRKQMVVRDDALFVLRAALAWERHGRNRKSEYDR